MLGVLDQPKTLGLDPASPRLPFMFAQRLEANADSFRLEIEREGRYFVCLCGREVVQPVLPFQFAARSVVLYRYLAYHRIVGC
jgi:hypothetical protein